ncbi:Flagellar protein FliJ [Citrifermentans bremense]|uniref:Flagellar FliJ protein n=2 Tax=Geobacteraceae TaxID=213422 RepID=A0ABQ0MN87_9BACT|nr:MULTISPECIES: flagellar export protein FliJ [Geobacteraceae]BCG48976.1 Flagellar protein FliJ [Citrifermentans bremense]GAW68543.1 flagellar export protein FliJ [Geoanaerobacter pelophilus]
MAGYEFRLEQVLKFRKEVEKIQQLELLAARQRHETVSDQLNCEEKAIEELDREFTQRQMEGIQASDLQLFGDYRLRKRNEINRIKEELPALEQAVQEKRESLIVAAKEKKVLEIFKQKKLHAHRVELLEKERNFMDEVAIQGRGARQ